MLTEYEIYIELIRNRLNEHPLIEGVEVGGDNASRDGSTVVVLRDIRLGYDLNLCNTDASVGMVLEVQTNSQSDLNNMVYGRHGLARWMNGQLLSERYPSCSLTIDGANLLVSVGRSRRKYAVEFTCSGIMSIAISN